MEEKTPEEMAKDINAQIKAIQDTATSKEEANKLIKAELEKYDTDLKKTINDLNQRVLDLQEKGTKDEDAKKGTFIDFVEKNIEEKDTQTRDYSANMTIKAPALMTTSNVTPNVAGGFNPLFGNYVDTMIGSVPKADPFILPLVTVTNQPGTESIWYVDRVNEEGDAEFIAEGSLKPLIDAEYAATKKDVKEVAERWKFTKRLMNHAPSVVTDFRVHANELIENKIDDGVVSGAGGATELEGIETLASAFVVPPSLALYYQSANIFDVIMATATSVRLANFKGQLTCILNTVWMAQMQGIKNAEDDYIIPPFVTQDGRQVGEVRVVFTNRLADTKIILGDLKKFNVVVSENVEYDEGYENDDFSKNLVSRKLEAFLGTYMKASDAGSIVSDDIATILTAIDKV